MTSPKEMFHIFLIVNRKDEEYKHEFIDHLSMLVRHKLVSIQDNLSLKAGSEIEETLNQFIRDSDCTVALLSRDFWSCDNCFNLLEKTKAKIYLTDPCRIGILIRPFDLIAANTFIESITLLPEDKKFIGSSINREEIFSQVAEFMRKLAVKCISNNYQHQIAALEQEREKEPSNHFFTRKLANTHRQLANFQKKYLQDSDEDQSSYNYNKAIDLLDSLPLADPNKHIALSQKGDLLRELNEPEQAKRSYKEGLERKPEDKILLQKTSGLYLLQGHYEEALDLYNKIISLDSEDYMAWTHRAEILESLGQYREAIDAYKKALDIKPIYRYAKHKQNMIFSRIRESHKSA
jgi:tetratricopeptide (TPR) repeat protein